MSEADVSTLRSALVVSCVSSFMIPYLSSASVVALPTIGGELGLNAVSLGWVSTSFLLTAAAFLLPFGKLGDMSGRKRVYLIGNVLFAVFSLLAALAPSGSALIGATALLGAASAMIFATSIAIVTSVYPPAQRGRVLGIVVAFTYTGLSMGPLLGGLLTHTLGWRSVYAMNAPIAAFVVLLVVTRLKGEWLGEKGGPFDLPGALFSVAALALVIFGLSTLPAPRGFAIIAAGLLALLLFVLRERRARNPLLSLTLFSGNRVFGMSNLAALINYSATFAVTFFLSLYLQYVKGLTPESAGFVLVAQPVLMAAFSPLAGRLSDRHEPRILASIGMGIMAAMLALLATAGQRMPLALLVAELAVVGIGYAFFSSPNTNAVMGSVDRRAYGVASATLGTMRVVGQMLSMGIAMLILSLNVGPRSISAAIYPLFLRAQHASFAIFAVLCLAGVFASLLRGETKDREAR